MSQDNQISVVIPDQTITDVLGHITAIRALLPFLKIREAGDTTVMLGQKSVGFDEKCAAYMASNPEFLPGFVSMAEVLKDRAAREQFLKFKAEVNLLNSLVEDSFNILGNEIMKADLFYYGGTGEAAKVGRPGAKDIHDDLATRYPGRSSGKPPQNPPQ